MGLVSPFCLALVGEISEFARTGLDHVAVTGRYIAVAVASRSHWVEEDWPERDNKSPGHSRPALDNTLPRARNTPGIAADRNVRTTNRTRTAELPAIEPAIVRIVFPASLELLLPFRECL
jgi:hypothetical protein